MIAEQEWNNFTYEDVDRWPKERVDYYLARMNATEQLREERRKKAEDEARFGEKPDWLTQEEWDMLNDDVKKRVGDGKLDKKAVKRHVERQKQKQDD